MGVWQAAVAAAIIVVGVVARYVWIFRQMHREAFPRDERVLRPNTGIPPIRGDYHDGERD